MPSAYADGEPFGWTQVNAIFCSISTESTRLDGGEFRHLRLAGPSDFRHDQDLDDWVHQDDVLEKLWAICHSLFPYTAFFLAHLHPGQLCNLLCTLLLLLLLVLLLLLALLLCLHLHLLHPGQESD